MSRREVSVLVCDLGRVLLPFDTKPVWQALGACCDDLERARQAFHEEWVACEMGKGRMDPQEFFGRVAPRMGLRMEYPLFCRAFSDMFSEDAEVIALVRTLPVRRRVLLSNTNVFHWEWVTANYAHALDFFDRLVVSHECGLEKPDPAIYAFVTAESGCPPEEHLFIDDIRENIEGALAAGWDAILHTDAASLRAALAARGLL
jgi:putative hydrolase of the HAD superfamily